MKEEFEIMAIDYLKGEISLDDKVVFEKFLSNNPSYQKEFEDLKLLWKDTNAINVPEPSEQMDVKFFDMLNSETEIQKKPNLNWFSKFSANLSILMKPQFAYGLLLLTIGLSIGYFLKPKETQTVTKIVANDETEEVREKLVLTLLKQPSVNKRLQGVSEANRFGKVDETVIKALLQTLNKDSNVNVRLAAIESLTNYVSNPVVRQGLVQSIPNQESPIVQVTLANLMAALQEKNSIEPFKKLLQNQELDTTVKKKIESTIQSII
ncbi:HEAT repeat domain-containing protein [uncultured Croceitalea sp.]|uniref:HEAT repeat domain-containing protein n=1 Tax=uncultured Croceitalea sp. TaxID=1798908 RepID=UPI00374E481B